MSTPRGPATIIDVSMTRSRDDLHALLAEKLRFPAYYGGNWDAFDECIADVAVPLAVEIRGTSTLRLVLPNEARLLKECFADAAARIPGLEVRFHGA
jgi:RNAse (barnase) inhibitor barstar